jgi:hypothetical protein
MISSKNDRVFIHYVSNLTLQIIFDTSWATIDVCPKRHITWNAPLGRFNLHWEIAETGSPGIICIFCHQVFRHPSEHGTRSMVNHLLANAHITKLNKLAESDVTELTSWMDYETALAVLESQGSRGIAIVRANKKIIFDIQVMPY